MPMPGVHHSIERTSPGKPGAASHVKRWNSMKHWLVISIALAVNASICFMTLAPALVTWVHSAPQYIKCGTAEVQEALA
jgi:anti-sigma-K factor RskA